jgi:hypothetical protein
MSFLYFGTRGTFGAMRTRLLRILTESNSTSNLARIILRPLSALIAKRNITTVAYALALNLVRSGTCSKYRKIEREVVLDNHKQRWPTMFIIFMMYKTNDGFYYRSIYLS